MNGTVSDVNAGALLSIFGVCDKYATETRKIVMKVVRAAACGCRPPGRISVHGSVPDVLLCAEEAMVGVK